MHQQQESLIMLSNTNEANEYRKEFHSYYYEKILPILEQFEAKRKIRQVQQSITVQISILLLILSFGSIFFTSPSSHTGAYLMFSGLGGVALSFYIGQSFTKEVKKAIFKNFLRFFGKFTWSSTGSISNEEVKKSKLLVNPNYIISRDCFDGYYKGLRIIISNCRESKGFCGVFMKIELNKRINSQTIVAQNNVLEKLCSSRYLMQNVELEDPEFSKMFKIYSRDQTEARYILTTSFMERFKQLKDVFKSESIGASFLENSLFIVIPCIKEMFVLGDLRKPVTDSTQFQEFFDQFLAVLSIVDVLHLDAKTAV